MRADRDEVLVLTKEVGRLPTNDRTLLILILASAIATFSPTAVRLTLAVATFTDRSSAETSRLADTANTGPA